MVVERRSVLVHGTVQGVGFRPFVYGLAARYRLSGFVRNRSGTVQIEVEGAERALDHFLRELHRNAPPLARILNLSWRAEAPRGERGFRIESSSDDSPADIFLSADMGTCGDCLAEMYDPKDRRFRYPFINCTHCGPRLTIICQAPYDRERTTMADFAMCATCRREYEDPRDRRFHAQPIACPRCGPRLELSGVSGPPIPDDEPLRRFVENLRQGGIGALKGLGGFHLVCDAGNARAVRVLRARKHRDDKPLALMVRDLEAAHRLCCVDDHERELLTSPRRPIVLLRKRPSDRDVVAADVAPDNPYLGIMLPYTPLHFLLMDIVGDTPLVMTSGNQHDEPIAYRDSDARERLGKIADVFLTHNRAIHVRCDDSVTRSVDGVELLLRRSRGYAPEPIRLPHSCMLPVLAVGGHLKNVFALGIQQHAILSQHVGDLDHLDAYAQFERDIDLYQDLFETRPRRIVHDLHPDYASTRYAQQRAAKEDIPTLAVQHHHAHMASCMAENGLNEPVIGVTFDGTGYGLDEITGEPVVWGGEFLVGDYDEFHRAARLRYVRMPGGEKAIAEPWRMALSHLLDASCDVSLLAERIQPTRMRAAETMLERSFHSPLTSSAGRLFDAVAALAGLRFETRYEAQAAMELEWLATSVARDTAYPFEVCLSPDPLTPGVVDTRPLIRSIAADARSGTSPARIGRRFHCTMNNLITEVCMHLRQRTGIDTVALSGGVFLNALLTREASQSLTQAGFRVCRHRLVPPNDGGLCLGQLAISAVKNKEATVDDRAG